MYLHKFYDKQELDWKNYKSKYYSEVSELVTKLTWEEWVVGHDDEMFVLIKTEKLDD